MIHKEVKYAFADIVMLPAVSSPICSRDQCEVLDANGMLPLITSPMYSVVDDKNISLFTSQKIYGSYPRGLNVVNPIPNTFVAYGIHEFENKYILNGRLKEVTPETPHYVMIDIANGHMERLTHLIKKSRRMSYGNNELILMVGNIAHPGTYQTLAYAGANYVRFGVGSGSACFVAGTKIKMSDDTSKNIDDVDIGDSVLTHMGNSQKVIAISSHKEKENLIKINDTVSTKDHKYYVLHKKYEKYVDDDNIHQFASWIEAKDLTDDYLLIDLG